MVAKYRLRACPQMVSNLREEMEVGDGTERDLNTCGDEYSGNLRLGFMIPVCPITRPILLSEHEYEYRSPCPNEL